MFNTVPSHVHKFQAKLTQSLVLSMFQMFQLPNVPNLPNLPGECLTLIMFSDAASSPTWWVILLLWGLLFDPVLDPGRFWCYFYAVFFSWLYCWAVCSGILKMVEGIHVEVYINLLISLIISWTFRILVYEEDQYSYVYKMLSQIFVYITQTT